MSKQQQKMKFSLLWEILVCANKLIVCDTTPIVLNFACFGSISFCEKFEIKRSHQLSRAKMASEEQNSLAKIESWLVCG